MKHIKIRACEFNYPIGSDMFSVKKAINIFVDAFLTLNYPPDTSFNLWCRGSSGAILASAFAFHPLLDKYTFYICHVKKTGEESHSSPLGAHNEFAINIVIDDFVQSGATINAITTFMTECSFINIVPNMLIVMFGWERIKHDFEIVISS